jgi:hypothetical protein
MSGVRHRSRNPAIDADDPRLHRREFFRVLTGESGRDRANGGLHSEAPRALSRAELTAGGTCSSRWNIELDQARPKSAAAANI